MFKVTVGKDHTVVARCRTLTEANNAVKALTACNPLITVLDHKDKIVFCQGKPHCVKQKVGLHLRNSAPKKLSLKSIEAIFNLEMA
jgi:hypothetical protein